MKQEPVPVFHSHPHGCSNAPSAKDKKLYEEMSDELGKNDYPFVMGILSDEGLRVDNIAHGVPL